MENKSYNSIVKQIVEKIQQAKADTLTGSELLKDMYKNLSESTNITPLLNLKPFITGAEKIAGDDKSLKDVIDFCKKSIVGNADLNFLIGLVKEEHFSNLSRDGHPDPKTTIKSIEDQFNQPSTVIEAGIRAGLFDNLKSKLLNQIKIDLGIVEDKKVKSPILTDLKESNQILFGNTPDTKNIVRYSPVGLQLENFKDNKLYILTESCVFQLDNVTKELKSLSESESVEIPEEYNKLMIAIESCKYSPETNSFSLNESWDFDLRLNSDNTVYVNDKIIPNDKVKTLLFESIQTYISNPLKIQNFNKLNYLKDADNFLALMENSNALCILNNLEVIRNLNESKYIIIDKESVYDASEPKILFATDGLNKKYNTLFESYGQMVNESNSLLNSNIVSLFESKLINEQSLINDRNQKIVSLMESQKEINTQISKVSELKKLSDFNSPAMDKLNQQELLLNQKLNENLSELNFYKNEFKLI